MKKALAALLAAAVLLSACNNVQAGQSVAASADAPESSATIRESSAAVQPQSQSVAEPESEAVSSQVQSVASEESTLKADSTQAQPWWRQGLARENLVKRCEADMPSMDDRHASFYVYDDRKKVSYKAWGGFSALEEDDNDRAYDVSLILNSAAESDDIGARILPDNFFELVAVDDTKYTGEFFEAGIKLTRSLPGQDKGDSVLLALDAADYNQLKANVTEELKGEYGGGAAWLSMMRQSRMVSATITSHDGASTKTLDFTKPLSQEDEDYLFKRYFYEDANPHVSGSCQVVSDKSLPDAATVTIQFNNGLVFNVFYNEEQVLVTASDVEASLLYRYFSLPDVEIIDDYAQGEKMGIVRTAKPVIYLYPTVPTTCRVTVGCPEFTYTYPAYGDGWQVTAYPDGRMINQADGTEHYYLFWESNSQVVWDFSEGFVVKGADSEAFLREKLDYLGLTPREYNDFITYWVPQMQDAAYNLITFASDRYEAYAPLTVTPTPDSVLRVHMVFKAIDAPVTIREQKLTPFERNGFTVVEWGGTNAGKTVA